MQALLETRLPGLTPLHKGKVRDIYDLGGDRLLIVSTDRISAFDCVFPNGVAGKGQILTAVSNKWFSLMSFAPNHILETDVARFPAELQAHADQLAGRSVIVRRAERVDFECIVRGYLAGSAWKEYQRTGTVCGELLPPGLKESERLPYPIFTPSTKADSGHDVNIPFSTMVTSLGKTLAEEIRVKSIQVYEKAHQALAGRDIILADTKYEFGLVDGKLILIDELLTPDSSRFWPKATYRTGVTPPGFDKQYVRDYVEKLGWDKRPPAPVLPDDVVGKTLALYRQIEALVLAL